MSSNNKVTRWHSDTWDRGKLGSSPTRTEWFQAKQQPHWRFWVVSSGHFMTLSKYSRLQHYEFLWYVGNMMTGSALVETPTGHTWTLWLMVLRAQGQPSLRIYLWHVTVLPYLLVLECIIDSVLHNKCIVMRWTDKAKWQIISYVKCQDVIKLESASDMCGYNSNWDTSSPRQDFLCRHFRLSTSYWIFVTSTIARGRELFTGFIILKFLTQALL